MHRGAQPNAWLPGCLGALVATGAPGQPCVALGYAAGRWHQHISCRRPDPARHRRDRCGRRSRGSWGRCGCGAKSGPQLVRQVRADRARPCATNQPAPTAAPGSSPSSLAAPGSLVVFPFEFLLTSIHDGLKGAGVQEAWGPSIIGFTVGARSPLAPPRRAAGPLATAALRPLQRSSYISSCLPHICLTSPCISAAVKLLTFPLTKTQIESTTKMQVTAPGLGWGEGEVRVRVRVRVSLRLS